MLNIAHENACLYSTHQTALCSLNLSVISHTAGGAPVKVGHDEASIRVKAEEVLSSAQSAVKKAFPGIHLEAMMGEGDAGEVLCRRAESDNADMIIVGSAGKSAIKVSRLDHGVTLTYA